MSVPMNIVPTPNFTTEYSSCKQELVMIFYGIGGT